MSLIKKIPFEEAFVSAPVGKLKIKESEYDSAGSICVVDQGQSLVSGMTNRADLKRDDGPYIVFGDHTRIVKFIDFSFVVGADGVRLYKASEKYEPEFLYLFLKNSKLPEDGYGRHSKYLKELFVPEISKEKQRQIAARLKAQLAEVESARQAAQVQLSEASALKKRALETLFASVESWSPIGSAAKLQSGYAFKSDTFKTSGIRLLRNANILPGKVYWDDSVFLNESDAEKFSNYLLHENDVLISLDRPIISSGIKVARVSNDDLPALLVQRVGRFIVDPEKLDKDYLYAFLQTGLFISKITGHDQSLGVPHISPSQVEAIEIPLPGLVEQKALAERLKEITDTWQDLVSALQNQVNDLTTLPKSILAQAFEN